MIKGIYKILFLVISISFFISAAEMDVGNTHNTFFDECDTYLKEDNISIDYTNFSPEEQAIYFITPRFFDYSLFTHADALNNAYSRYINCSTSKLFLLNSVWRI